MLNTLSVSESTADNFLIQKICRNDYYYQNTYIIIDKSNDNQIIIDPGDNELFIEDTILKNNCRLSALLFTHGHFDHIGASWYLSERFNVPCYVHESDIRLVKQSPNYALLFEKKIIKVPLKIKPLSEYAGNIPKIIYTPGHTAGSCCFLLEKIIFTGDLLLLNETGRSDLPGGSEKLLKESLSRLFSICNEKTIIYPGHGEIFNYTDLKQCF